MIGTMLALLTGGIAGCLISGALQSAREVLCVSCVPLTYEVIRTHRCAPRGACNAFLAADAPAPRRRPDWNGEL